MGPWDQHAAHDGAELAGHHGHARELPAAPSTDRAETRPEIIEQLETLDDIIFAAIDGDPQALRASGQAWQKALDEVGSEAIEETRRQYLRHAQGVWDTLRRQPGQPPHKIFAAIEIIGLLVNSAR